MAEVIRVDICVIGAGSGGLSVAAGASLMGARVVLIERAKMGGDCLNYGCVPSKALLAAAHAAESQRTSGRFGIAAYQPEVDFTAVRDHVHGVIAAIAPQDSVERFEGLGVQVIQAPATFTARRQIEAGEYRIRAKYFVVATGSSPAVPPVPGIDSVPYLTNESIFELDHCPEHLIVLGGGPIGCELAQAHRRLGARVTVLEMLTLLPKDDPEAADVVRRRLIAEGIEIHEGATAQGIIADGDGIAVEVEREGEVERIVGSHLLVAAGRRANVDGLGLEAARIRYSPSGIEVDRRLRTSNKRVFAIGDVAGSLQLTHMAGYHAGIVIRNALFKLPAKVSLEAIPWVTYTDPELAHVGMTEDQARDAHGGDMTVLRWPFAENDRAQAKRQTDGMIKVVVDKKGRILGATIAGSHAGELILPWVLAIENGLKIGAMAGAVAPYPTLSEVSKRLAGSYFTPKLFSERTRKLVRFLLKF
ncbi:MAG: FAD-dependent oxidoreductase [Alphaproteobacteria bacterium]|jgi:pyruvate/2-oxoglutarate dehydrogenase complex dihydrolipoamide dehydrogenase (E3) component|nr:FAD-dependent oxidoreductase [Alphaproteobacteria bacterium]